MMATDQQPTPALRQSPVAKALAHPLAVMMKYARFIGPGAMVSVAYMDPGNYATDITAGASFKFKLLFIVLISNFVAIFLQSLAIKLGSVTGLNLAQMIRLHTHRYLNWFLYAIAEIAIVATDMAEVIGTAIALKMLFKIPLVAGCIISIADVLFILLFYSPGNALRSVRIFELLVFVLVLGVVVCFCYQLSLISENVGTVLKGYVPNDSILNKQGIYQACGIVGATVMPHSLYLGSGTIQARLLDYDQANGLVPKTTLVSFEAVAPSKRPPSSASNDSLINDRPYLPSLRAINFGLKTSIIELAVSLCIFALFVNSAILIVAGAALYSPPGTAAADDATNATLFAIHDLLSQRISPAAGAIFGVALLLSGVTAGIVCTIAGQIVSEGQIAWRIKPWQRRLCVRSLAITPSVIIAGSIGEQGISVALEASQVVLCFCLPFCAAPLLWFTAFAKYQKVQVLPNGERLAEDDGNPESEDAADADADPDQQARDVSIGTEMIGMAPVPQSERDEHIMTSSAPSIPGQEKSPAAQTVFSTAQDDAVRTVYMNNHWITTAISVIVWVILLAMNLAAVVMLGLGVGN